MLLSLFYRGGNWGSDLSQLGSGGAEINLRLVWLESWVVICLGDHQGTLVGVVRAWDVGRVLGKERVKEKNARGGWEEKRKEQRKEVYNVMELKLAAIGSRATIDSENRCLFLWDEWETSESPPSNSWVRSVDATVPSELAQDLAHMRSSNTCWMNESAWVNVWVNNRMNDGLLCKLFNKALSGWIN